MEWVVLCELNDLFQLQAAKALLESNGIESEVLSLHDAVYPSISRYRLVVPSENVVRARGLLKEKEDE